MSLLEIRSLVKYYPVRTGLFSRRQAKAIDNVDLTVNQGETIGIVGAGRIAAMLSACR